MAKGDIKIHENPYNSMPTETWQTEANATAIYAGEPVKLKTAGSPYVIPLADDEPVIGTTTQFVGIAKSDSTQTASADGSVEVYLPLEGITWRCKATTAANFDTRSEINALRGDRVLFDLADSSYTVDENAGDDATYGIQIIDGNPDTAEVYFKIRTSAVEGPVA